MENKKIPRIVGPAVHCGTQSAMAKRAWILRKSLLQKPSPGSYLFAILEEFARTSALGMPAVSGRKPCSVAVASNGLSDKGNPLTLKNC